jgi:transcriptional regulator with XRE-family HTH domain
VRAAAASTQDGEDAQGGASRDRRRAELGLRLLALRREAGLTQTQLAIRLGVRQPSVSRFEAGRDLPTPEMLCRIAEALDLPTEALTELEDRIAEQRIEVRAARLLAREGARAVQLEVARRESIATEVWSFHLALVPGLLQTPDYTRAMATVLDPETEVDVEALVSGRQERQRLLLDPGRRFRFLMTEAALRTRVASLDVLRGQLRRMVALAEGFPTVELGVIPLAPPLSAWTLTGFDVAGDVVEVEHLTGSVMVRDPRDVALYRRQFDHLAAQAVHGEAAIALFHEVDAWLAGLEDG